MDQPLSISPVFNTLHIPFPCLSPTMKCSRPNSFSIIVYESLSIPVYETISKPAKSTVKHEPLLSFPNCRVHLVGSKEAVEIANGDFSIVKLLEGGVDIATVIKVGDDLLWPLTKDEPVVKLDSRDYLFSLPMRGGEPLSYGVSFVGNSGLVKLDEFLAAGNSCFSILDSSTKMKGVINWKDYAPKVDDFNTSLAKAISIGTGHVVKGIFMCTEAYSKEVQKMGQMKLTHSVPEKKKGNGASASGALRVTLRRVRDLSKFIEEISREMLEGIGIVIGSALAPVLQSEQAKGFLSMVPGQVLLVSLDAVNRVMEAAEIAKRIVVRATSAAATRMLTQRYGEDVGEAAGDVLAMAENCVNTAWNVYKMRKAMNPTTTALGSGLLLKNALRNYNMKTNL